MYDGAFCTIGAIRQEIGRLLGISRATVYRYLEYQAGDAVK
jgi:predicted transcriptional regulator YheO